MAIGRAAWMSVVGAVLLGLSSVTNSAFAAQGFQPTVYVYAGKGACKDGCVSAAVKLARRHGLPVVRVKSSDISGPVAAFTPRVGDLWIQPGGDAIEAAQTLTPTGLARLRGWVDRGLNYLGFCAGAFLADSTVDDPETIEGLGLISFNTADYMPGRHEPMMLLVNWLGANRWLYFQDGATFRTPNQAGVQTIATYETGQAAVLQTEYGRGNVVLSGVHPEAEDDWAPTDGLTDPDGADHDLADEVLFRALGLR